MSNTIAVQGWHLENRIGSHRKFYTVLIAENGVVVTAWGRIGTAGQSKIQKLPYADAEALGLRQVYSKQTGGYTVIVDKFKFALEEEALLEAARRSITAPLTRAFHDAVRDPKFEGDKEVVLKHYDDLVIKAQRMLGEASERPFDEVYAEFEELERAWQAIKDKHDETAITIDLTKQTLARSLMSGNLG
jgi:predicted DNA-binding WGR domain protein